MGVFLIQRLRNWQLVRERFQNCLGKIFNGRPDENGKLITVCSQEIYGIIRSLAIFRLTGNNRDYVVIGSDSGRIVIL